jgi:hypothetical protein
MDYLLETYLIAVALTALCRFLWSQEQLAKNIGPQQDSAGQTKNRNNDGVRGFYLKVPVDDQKQGNAEQKIDRYIMYLIVIAAFIALLAITYNRIFSNDWGNNSDKVVAAFTAVLSLVALLQWLITGRQVQQTESTLDLMRQELRPWVSIVKPKIEHIGNQHGWIFSCTLHNHGKIPATIVSCEFGGVCQEFSNETLDKVRANITEATLIHPNMMQVIAPDSDGTQLQNFDLPQDTEARQRFWDGINQFSCALRVNYIATKWDDGFSTGGMYMFHKTLSGWAPMVIGGPDDNYMK